jgi:hypothetical protein
MLEPLKTLDKLWDKIAKAKISPKRRDFLLTIVTLATVVYVFSIPLMLLLAKQVADLVEYALHTP